MFGKLLRGCAVAVIPLLLATPAPGQVEVEEAPPRSSGIAFAALDPDHEIRDAVEGDVSARIARRLGLETARGEVWTETMHSALAVVSSEINRLEQDGRLEEDSRSAIGALAAIAVVDVLVDQHPELLPALADFVGDMDPQDSPVERVCACDKGGSRACGCSVWSNGPGSCNYKVLCSSWIRAGCSAINFELCIVDTVVEIVSPFGGGLHRSSDPGHERGTARGRAGSR